MSDDKNINDEEMIILEDEKSLVLDHNYDGIQELNHPLPFWWVWIFILTTIFAIPYVYYYHMNGGGLSLDGELKERMVEVRSLREANQAAQGSFDLNAYTAYVGGPDAKSAGAKNYKRRCRSCHGAKGEGGIGPNLTDKFWLHGTGNPEGIYTVIDKGVDANGMPAWGEMLDKEVMFAITDHILDMQGTNPDNAKAAQGTEVK